jgi:hypothetical protein
MQIFWDQNVHVWEDPDWPKEEELPHSEMPDWEDEGNHNLVSYSMEENAMYLSKQRILCCQFTNFEKVYYLRYHGRSSCRSHNIRSINWEKNSKREKTGDFRRISWRTYR